MKWMEALKQYNSGKAMWCIPKKGSPEYFDVRALMGHDSAKDIEARNVERREKSVAQLREATKHMKPGVREDEPPKKEIVKAIEKKVKEPIAKKEHISPELKKKFMDDMALEIIYGNDVAGKKRIASLISDMDKVLSGKQKPVTSLSEYEPSPMSDRNAYTYKSKTIYDVGPKIPKDTYKKFRFGMNGFDLMYYSKDLKSLMADLPGRWILQPIETDVVNSRTGYNTLFMGMIDMS